MILDVEVIMKKIFVTGGDGFIGSHLVERLIEQGHEVPLWLNITHLEVLVG